MKKKHKTGLVLRTQCSAAPPRGKAFLSALLPAALRRLRERECLKRRVEVQIRRVQDAHAHLRRTRRTSRQRPVSLSTSKIAPSSLAAPMAAS